MANPKNLRWNHDLKWSDDSTLTAVDFVGFTLYIDSHPAVSVPIGYEADGEWVMPLANFPAATSIGDHALQLTLKAKRTDGTVVESDKSEPVSYSWADERVPKRPFGLGLS